MGSFFTDILSFQHETAVFDVNPHQLRFVYNTYRFTTLEEIKEFEPELVINAVTVKYTLDAFRKVLPVLPKDCIISDIASVKTGLKKFYEESGFRYVSSHPMFGPTFASLSNLSSENAIIISEGDHLGKIFFKDLYQTLRLNIFEYTFDEHDETVAYSLSIPFVSTFVFAAVMKHQEAPGTTFKKHMNMTCIQYINNIRLEKAVALFEHGNTSILEVSLSVGFHNLSYFYRAFKAKYHMTPLAFIKRLELDSV